MAVWERIGKILSIADITQRAKLTLNIEVGFDADLRHQNYSGRAQPIQYMKEGSLFSLIIHVKEKLPPSRMHSSYMLHCSYPPLTPLLLR
mmetsp:Transcript_28278/g.43984  ORF Transcript_28278/g.43984 Transcript_28278/m.43984 type:complete len:90 (+) Transcript_28278:226-495(+)